MMIGRRAYLRQFSNISGRGAIPYYAMPLTLGQRIPHYIKLNILL